MRSVPPIPPDLEHLTLFDFSDAPQVDAWRPIHDRVMGGVSSGRVTAGEGAVRFEGHVSLENNGGFASFRIAAPWPDLSRQDGLRLRVRGDGKVYKLGLRTEGAGDEISWQVPFATVSGTWTTVDVAFEKLVPTRRGRLVSGAKPFDPARIRQVGILISDQQAGPFALELSSIEAWRATRERPDPPPMAR